ncbi:MAG TPA: homoserine dehydrogenase [Blastocatellia bacterium]|jgi:homoserine dehydrogenase|nr:homoserine dehydrogenase [Blastocatellia bacterium]HCX31403.1 homoserine dehydrogenase [Blastocatellia bacterium]
MKQYNLCFLGFGNVGRALARLLGSKSAEMRELYGVEYRITGVASRKIGWQSSADGFESSALLSNETLDFDSFSASGIGEWLQIARPDAVFETTSLNPESGQPAIDYLRAVLQSGAHAITANKGALVYGYQELNQLACGAGKQFLFESAVLDSAPVFSLFRETLPAVNLRGFSGILSSTTNVIIETMEAGRSFAEGLKTAQELGVTETDASHDVDGWDATVKVCALANVLMNIPLKPADVSREGIRDLSPAKVQAARADGKPFKLVARAKQAGNGKLAATVRPEQIAASDPLGNVRGTSLAIHFELDMMPGLTITSHRPNLQSTAYGLLADFINAVRY